MGLLSRIGRMGGNMADNAKFYGAGSNAAMGALTGAGMTAAGGGDTNAQLQAALAGGLGGAGMTTLGKIPSMLGALAGPVAAFAQLLKQKFPDAPEEAIMQKAQELAAQAQQGGGMPPGGMGGM